MSSDNNPSVTRGAPFTSEQSAWLDQFLPSLNRDQMMWMQGFLAGATLRAGAPAAGGAAPVGDAPQMAAGAQSAATAKPAPLTILFGSESGNAASLADETAKLAKTRGFAPEVHDMEEYDRSRLSKEENLFVLVSTWGDGDPPEAAAEFYAFIMGDEAPRLEGTRFSVLALGDTSYEQFCKTGKDFDARLEELGATRLHPRQDCDLDFDEPYAEWVAGALEAFAEQAVPGETAVLAGPVEGAEQTEYSRRHPFPAKVLENVVLNSPGSATIKGSNKQTHHVELSLEGSGLTYEPGDSIGVFPRNCPETVDALLKDTSLKGTEPVPTDEGEKPLRDALIEDYDITALSRAIIEKYAAVSKIGTLDELLNPDNQEKLAEYLNGREIVDLLVDFPWDGLNGGALLKLLRPLPARLYSIASSLKAHPHEAHLTVAAVHYETHGRKRKGVCSTFLGERLAKGDKVPVYLQQNKRFKLPKDGDAPIIMVGPGTGVAPFRAFVEDRVADGVKGKNWLFFGDQHFISDFLYQLEWQDYVKKGQLHKLSVAFSRDTAEKYYVQDRMWEERGELFAWLQEGAHFYVCGDATRMAKDVHATLVRIVKEEGGMKAEAAEDFIKKLDKEGRYQRDVY